ncbi:MAG: FadR/GntR family transcriptional regulator [Hydrogenophaga sp.]
MKKDAASAPPQARTNARFTSVKTRRGFEEVGDQIRAMLHTGELKAGDRLPSEQDLATGFGVSRPVIREALRTLEMAGILELKLGTKGGAYIRQGNADMLARPLQDLIALGRISIPNLIDARRMIHSVILQSACEHGTAADFAAIEANLDRMEALAKAKEWTQRTDEAVLFFHLIAKATHNEVMVILIDSLLQILRYVVLEKTPAGHRPQLVPLRRKILASLRARNAAQAIEHLNEYLQVVHKATKLK